MTLQYLRQMEKEQEDSVRQELDRDFTTIQALMSGSTPSALNREATSASNALNISSDRTYDQFVRELLFDVRARPKNRTKPEEEIALENKAALEKAERKRLKRMQGIVEDTSDEEQRSFYHRKSRHKGGIDELDDDTRPADEWSGLGTGLEERSVSKEKDGANRDDIEVRFSPLFQWLL